MRLHHKYSGYINALIAAALFGISSTLNKIVLKDVHPLVVSGAIYFSAGIILGIFRILPTIGIGKLFGICREKQCLKKRDWPYLLLVALSGAVIGPFLFLYGLNHSTAANASLLTNMEVLFTVLIALMFLKERGRMRDYLALLVMLAAGIVITTDLKFSLLGLGTAAFGNLFIIGGTLFWAIDNSLSKKLSIENDVVKIASLKSLIGGGTVLAACIILDIPLMPLVHNAPYILFVGFFSIGLSIVLFLSALRTVGSMRTILLFSTASLFGLICAYLVLGERVSGVQLAAGLAMLPAVYVISRKSSEKD